MREERNGRGERERRGGRGRGREGGERETTHFLMESISCVILSNSWMAEKSLPNPALSPPPAEPEEVGVDQVTEVLEAEEAAVGIKVPPPHPLAAELEEGAELEGVVDGGGSVTLPLREGGTMAGVSSSGMSFFRTFSAIRYMARANCSALRRPVFSMSHRFLGEGMREEREIDCSGVAQY